MIGHDLLLTYLSYRIQLITSHFAIEFADHVSNSSQVYFSLQILEGPLAVLSRSVTVVDFFTPRKALLTGRLLAGQLRFLCHPQFHLTLLSSGQEVKPSLHSY